MSWESDCDGGERIDPRQEIERLKIIIQDLTREEAVSRRIANEVTEEIARLEKEHRPSRETMIAVLVAAMENGRHGTHAAAARILDGAPATESCHQRATVIADLLGWRPDPEDSEGERG